jgi:hypothetical protein
MAEAEADTPTTPGDIRNEGDPTAPGDKAENGAEKQLEPPDRSAIYVDDSAPATLRYSETSVSYPTTREAITAWLALPPEIKKDALITTQGNGARYHGWAIYRLWGR